VTIKNIRAERLQELKSTIRWTLEKMYEKMKQTSSV
jgi:3-hydroxyacyl-CoA dehydrogenase